jgi:hypothetical protein
MIVLLALAVALAPNTISREPAFAGDEGSVARQSPTLPIIATLADSYAWRPLNHAAKFLVAKPYRSNSAGISRHFVVQKQRSGRI